MHLGIRGVDVSALGGGHARRTRDARIGRVVVHDDAHLRDALEPERVGGGHAQLVVAVGQ